MPPIILPRRTLHAFRTALKKHLGLKARDDGPCVRIDAGAEGGTRLTAVGPDGRGVSLHIPGDRSPAGLVLPFQLLAEAGSAKNGDVQLSDADRGSAAVANWDERGVPRSARHALEKKDRDGAANVEPPAVPEWHDPGEGFGEALRAACDVTDADSGRYALGCVRLDPNAGRIEATDSHHLLIARGFRFGFDKPVLLPAPHALCTAPLRKQDVRVAFLPGGAQAGVLALQCGDWTLWTPEVRDARFPDLDRVVPSKEGKASVSLSETDAAFLLDRIASLPGVGAERGPITLEAKDDAFLIRAAEEDGKPVELATASSRVRGEAICVADRRFIARALSAGFAEIVMNGPEEPVRCDGNEAFDATFVFATLAGDAVPAKDAVRLAADELTNPVSAGTAETPVAARNGRVPQPATTTRIAPTMPRNRITEAANGYRTNGSSGHAVRGDESPDSPPDHDALLERVSALGSTLSDAASEARSLATDLRKLKRRNRAVTGALAGLKRLGSLVA